MQISRIVPLVPAAAGLVILLGSGAASAQSQRQTAPAPTSNSSATIFQQQQGTGLPPVDASQNTRGTDNREIFRVLGFSGQIAAPVTPAYDADAGYRTFAGQPARGPDAVLAQTIDGAP